MKIAVVHHPSVTVEKAYIKVVLEQLKNIENSTCTEILLRHTLDYLHKRREALADCIQKLRYNGQLIVIGNDLITVSHILSNGIVSDAQQISAILYEGRQSIASSAQMIQMISEYGLKIVSVNYCDHEYIITAQREKSNVTSV